MARRMTTEEFITKAREIHGSKFDYSKVIYVNKKTPVNVICPEHGEYKVLPHIHARCDCKKCYLERKSKTTSKTTEQFVSDSRKVHGSTYDYSVTSYINKRTKVSIVCNKHGVFEQSPSNHLNGSGCLKCSRTEVGKKRKGQKNTRRVTNTEEFIRESKIIHGDFFDYSSSVYTCAKDLLVIKCPEHGEFLQTAHNHLTGFKCRKCANENIATKFSMGLVTFIEKAKKIHGEKYDYSQTEYKNANDKVSVVCKAHGMFLVFPNHHLRGIACKSCMDEFKTKSLEDFLSESRILHADCYDYSLVNYINNNTVVKIACPEHGVFEQLPRNHASNAAHGCPICNKISFWDLSRLSPEQLAEMNGVYVLILENRISGDQIVKVGISKNLKRRCKEIEWGSNNDYIVKPLSYYPQALSDAIKVETRIHQVLACYSEHTTTRFAGDTECFSIESLPILLNLGLLEPEQLERLSEGYELLDVTS